MFSGPTPCQGARRVVSSVFSRGPHGDTSDNGHLRCDFRDLGLDLRLPSEMACACSGAEAIAWLHAVFSSMATIIPILLLVTDVLIRLAQGIMDRGPGTGGMCGGNGRLLGQILPEVVLRIIQQCDYGAKAIKT